MDNKIFTATNLLALAIVFSFILQVAIPDYSKMLWLSDDQITTEPYRIFTKLFLHINLLHLFLNVYALIIFGNLLESKIGKKHLLWLFFIGSMAGVFSHLIAASLGVEEFTIVIGSSDAVSLMLGACAFLMANVDVKIFFIKMKVRTALTLFLIYEALDILNIFALQDNAVHSAHIGPIIFGYLYAKFLIK